MVKIEEKPKTGKGSPTEVVVKVSSWWPTYVSVFFILVIGWMLFVRPELNKAKEISEIDEVSLTLSINQKESKLLRIKKVSKSLDDLPPSMKMKLSEALPNQPNQPDLLINLDALGKNSSLDLRSSRLTSVSSKTIAPDNVVLPEGVRSVIIETIYEGVSYSTLKSFLRAIESNLRIIQVDKFGFNPIHSDINFTLTSFYYE